METFGRTMTAYGEINLGAEFSDIQPRKAIVKPPSSIPSFAHCACNLLDSNARPRQSFPFFLLPLHRSAEIKLLPCSVNVSVVNDFNDLLAVLWNHNDLFFNCGSDFGKVSVPVPALALCREGLFLLPYNELAVAQGPKIYQKNEL